MAGDNLRWKMLNRIFLPPLASYFHKSVPLEQPTWLFPALLILNSDRSTEHI